MTSCHTVCELCFHFPYTCMFTSRERQVEEIHDTSWCHFKFTVSCKYRWLISGEEGWRRKEEKVPTDDCLEAEQKPEALHHFSPTFSNPFPSFYGNCCHLCIMTLSTCMECFGEGDGGGNSKRVGQIMVEKIPSSVSEGNKEILTISLNSQPPSFVLSIFAPVTQLTPLSLLLIQNPSSFTFSFLSSASVRP